MMTTRPTTVAPLEPIARRRDPARSIPRADAGADAGATAVRVLGIVVVLASLVAAFGGWIAILL